jgi:hypothetical protein
VPTVVVLADDVASKAVQELGHVQAPVLLLGGAEGVDLEALGPRVVRLRTEATPEAILDALRDLAE